MWVLLRQNPHYTSTNGEFPLLAFSLFYCLRKGQIWQKGRVDNCGSYGNHTFYEIHQRSGKAFKWDKERGLLTVDDFHESGILEKMENWPRQRGKYWQMAIIRTWQTLVEQGKLRQKWRVCQKFVKGIAKYSNKITKRVILTNGDFTKITNLARIYRINNL